MTRKLFERMGVLCPPDYCLLTSLDCFNHITSAQTFRLRKTKSTSREQQSAVMCVSPPCCSTVGRFFWYDAVSPQR